MKRMEEDERRYERRKGPQRQRHAIREEELYRLHDKDKEDEIRRGLHANSKTKQYFDAFKGLLHKLPNMPAEVI